MGGFLALHFRPGFHLMYDLIDIAATRFPEQYKKGLLKASCAADLAVLADAEVMDAIVEAGRECFRHGADGLVTDAQMLYRQWPFDIMIDPPAGSPVAGDGRYVRALRRQQAARRAHAGGGMARTA